MERKEGIKTNTKRILLRALRNRPLLRLPNWNLFILQREKRFRLTQYFMPSSWSLCISRSSLGVTATETGWTFPAMMIQDFLKNKLVKLLSCIDTVLVAMDTSPSRKWSPLLQTMGMIHENNLSITWLNQFVWKTNAKKRQLVLQPPRQRDFGNSFLLFEDIVIQTMLSQSRAAGTY